MEDRPGFWFKEGSWGWGSRKNNTRKAPDEYHLTAQKSKGMANQIDQPHQTVHRGCPDARHEAVG